MQRILVIKLGALGDFIHAFHAFAAIRGHHAGDHVTLLTTAPYAAMAAQSPWFDAVAVDERAPWWNVPAIARTIRLIRGYDFVYDLQTSRRSSRYFALAGRPPWSGIARGCSHPHANPARDLMHTVARQREQLEQAGIHDFPLPGRDWLSRGAADPALAVPYVMLIPGGAGVGSVKRWPADRYAEIAHRLADAGYHPVIIGGPAESVIAETIRSVCPGAIDLTGRTSIPRLAALAEHAALVLGNDTGPLHVAASSGAPAIALFSAMSDRIQAGPLDPAGQPAEVITSADLKALTVDAVMGRVWSRLAGQLQTLRPGMRVSPVEGSGAKP